MKNKSELIRKWLNCPWKLYHCYGFNKFLSLNQKTYNLINPSWSHKRWRDREVVVLCLIRIAGSGRDRIVETSGRWDLKKVKWDKNFVWKRAVKKTFNYEGKAFKYYVRKCIVCSHLLLFLNKGNPPLFIVHNQYWLDSYQLVYEALLAS
jgi:hypothetical protein